MKFLCDRCKTRYSIADERVRGKILKIRCKNCANVITVREGMPAPVADDQRRKRPTTAAPPNDVAPTGALGAAFASQLAKPPPVLVEEWYVSIDGQQSGPFSLGDARRWVASKAHDAELYCWSEGFDDWLPVDKVSHFRGMRRPPAPAKRPTIPPPIPAPAPKPLFAATMASIEKAASGPTRLPSITSRPAAVGVPVAARYNGVPSVPSLPAAARAKPGLPRPLHPAAPAGAAVPPFKDDAATQIESPVFNDEIATAEPHAQARSNIPPPANYTIPVPLIDDDNLEIGEVSRVVKLADIEHMRRPARPTPGAMPAARNSASSVQRLTGTMPKLSPSALGMNVNPLEAGADESIVARSFAQRHRRGMVLLIAGSGLLVLGVIVLVALVVTKDNNELSGSLGGVRVIDTTRPEDIVRQQAGLPPVPAGSGTAAIVQRPKWHPHTQTQVEEPDAGPNKLDASDIEDMAAKNNEGTKRCYLRAQRGALGFDIAELKKIDVTLSVGKDGNVTDVELSSHSGDTFGQCLIGRIKGWRFRESRGGTFKFAMAFGGS